LIHWNGIEIIRDLRLGTFDMLVGINLLREGLDIPECTFVAVLDADTVTGSMERAMDETGSRREKQLAYNIEHHITPESVRKNITDILDSVFERNHVWADISGFAEESAMIVNNLAAHVGHFEKRMHTAAADLDFEEGSRLRDEIKRLQQTELAIADDPFLRETARSTTQASHKKRSLFAKPYLDAMWPTMDTGLLRTDGKNSNVRRNILNETTVGRPEVSGRNKQQNPHQKQAYPSHPERTGCKKHGHPGR